MIVELHGLSQIQEAHNIAWALWAAFFLLVYSQKVYYLGFCVLLAFAAGASALEYAPALFIPFELVLSGVDFFRSVRDEALGKRARSNEPRKAGL